MTRSLLAIVRSKGALTWQQEEGGKASTMLQLSIDELEDVITEFNSEHTTSGGTSVGEIPVIIEHGTSGVEEDAGEDYFLEVLQSAPKKEVVEVAAAVPVLESEIMDAPVSAQISALEAKLERFDQERMDYDASTSLAELTGVNEAVASMREVDGFFVEGERGSLQRARFHD